MSFDPVRTSAITGFSIHGTKMKEISCFAVIVLWNIRKHNQEPRKNALVSLSNTICLKEISTLFVVNLKPSSKIWRVQVPFVLCWPLGRRMLSMLPKEALQLLISNKSLFFEGKNTVSADKVKRNITHL